MKNLLLLLIYIPLFVIANVDSDKQIPRDLFKYLLVTSEFDSKIYPEWKAYISSFDEKKQKEIKVTLINLYEKDLNWRLKANDLILLTYQQNKIPDIESYLQNEADELRAAYIEVVKLYMPVHAFEARIKIIDDLIGYRFQNEKEFLQRFLPEFYSVETSGDIEQKAPQRNKHQNDMHAKRLILFSNPLLADSAIDDGECVNNINNPNNILKSWCFDESLRVEVEKIAKLIDAMPYKKESFYSSNFYDYFKEDCIQEQQASNCILNVAKNKLLQYTKDAETVKKEIFDF